MGFLDIDSLTQAMQSAFERSGLPENLPPMPEIPAGRYVDPAFFKLEMAALKRTWLFGVHGDDVPAPGSYRRWNQLGQPLVFIRGNDHKVRAFYNICRHRGAPLVSEECGEKRTMSCPIHGWTYRLDGELAGVPERRDFAEADLKNRSLMEVRCENIGEMYFVNFDEKAKPLLEDMGAVTDAWMMYRPDQSRLVARILLEVKANYKIVQEANMEVYHVATVHPEIVNAFLEPSSAATALYANGHSIQSSFLKKKDFTESQIDLPAVAEASAVSRIANVAFHLFPNRVIAMNDWGYPLQNYWPVDERTTQVEVLWFAPKTDVPQSDALWNEITGMFTKVLEQDFVYCVDTQRSMESGACRGLLMGAQERTIYHAHEELDRRIGIDRVPAQLRVRPVLDKMLVAA